MSETRQIKCEEGYGRIKYEMGDTVLMMTEDGEFTITAGVNSYQFDTAHSEELWALFAAHNDYMRSSRDMGIHTIESLMQPSERLDN